MRPSADQVRIAAYHRWQCRGADHGADLDDWVSAEQGLLFALNYRVIASHCLVAPAETRPPGRSRRVCLYCQRSAPHATFTDPMHAIPQFLGNRSLLTESECDECHAEFKESLELDLEWFSRPFRTGPASAWALREEGMAGHPLSLAAVKCLARMALSIMPEEEIDSFQDTVEWVANPDHELDERSFRGLGCFLHIEPRVLRSPWAALARRIRDDVPVPYLLFFLGTQNVTIEIPVPLCVRDDDLDGLDLVVPRVALPDAERLWEDASVCTFVPVVSSEAELALGSGVR